MASRLFKQFNFKRSLHAFHSALLTLFLSILLLCSGILPAFSSPKPEGCFSYQFIIDEDGCTLVRIVYSSNLESGSTWVLVPKFSNWLNYTLRGQIYDWSLEDSKNYTGVPYYFYKVLKFLFNSDNGFEIVIEYNFSVAAMIIEPDGIFYSPQIGFEDGNTFEASVIFPSTFQVNLNEALALGSRGPYGPDKSSNSTFILFRDLPPTENLLRIEIAFSVPNREADLVLLENGIFRFSTVKRYESYAWKILDLYNATYDLLVNLFNTSLEKIGSQEKGVTVKFFLPDFYSLMSIGGYVPFSGGKLGDIHINFIFTRYVEGYLEVIALHELIHHFLWRAGISPEGLLWFHEGLAQYVSIEIAEELSYEGAEMIKQDAEETALNVRLLTGGDLGFLVQWTPDNAPRDMSTLYAAAYYVVSRLAENRGGLSYYARFFRLLGGRSVEDNALLCYYLSIAANESVIDELNAWGFRTPDLYAYSPLINKVKSAIRKIGPLNPLLQPFRYLAELLYENAVSENSWIPVRQIQICLSAALLTALLAPLLALITYSALIFAALIFALKLKKVF